MNPQIRRRILIVEDENIVAMDIQRGLKGLGYEVVDRASRGEEALEKVQVHRPDLVLMDIQLKGQMNGIETANTIRNRFSIPIVFLTAYADESTLQGVKNAEPYGYLLKPFEERELHTVIEVALHKHQSFAAAQEQTHEALRRTEEQLQLFIDSVRDCAILMLDPDGRILTWNSGTERIKGYLPHETIGQDHSIFYTHEDIQSGKPNDALQIAAAKGHYQTEGWRLRKDGSRFWADVTITAVRGLEGQIRGFGKVTRDISERRAAEQEIRGLNAQLEQRVRQRTTQLETALKELESFSYSVSHDLRAPLRGIDGYIRILQEDYSERLDAEANRLINVARAETKRMGQLIDDLLAFSHLGRQSMQNKLVDLTALARDVYEHLIANNVPQSAPLLILKPLPPAKGDLAMLRQVFANLIANALKFSRTQPVPTVEIGGWTGSGEVTCYVKDNGIGFDEKYRHKLFGVFQRLHTEEEFEGTGVGLALVQRVIHRHGGSVWAEGKLNDGATFFFTLPITNKTDSGQSH